ncbi:MAG TPA: hypothetical protein VMU14_08525 [Acidimicrobiales bacterium]|nr:hypothetical protein [Acidimicrobiales bacterium]
MEGTVGLVGAGAMGAGMWRRLQAQGRRPLGFAMSHYCKDFDVALGLATEMGVPAPLGGAG